MNFRKAIMFRWNFGYKGLAVMFLAGIAFADPAPTPTLPAVATQSPSSSFSKFDQEYGKYIEYYQDKFEFQTNVALDDNFFRNETNWAPILMAPGKLLFYDGNGHYTHIGFGMTMSIPDAGSSNTAPISIILNFQNRAAVFEHKGDHDFYWLVDGKALPWITNEYDWSRGDVTEYGNDDHIENNYVLISPDTLKVLASAKVIDCRFGMTEFYFGPIQFWILNKFENLYQSITQSNATPGATPQ